MARKNGKESEKMDVRLRPRGEKSGGLALPTGEIGRWLDTLRRDFDAMLGDRFGFARFGEGLRFPRTDVVDAGDHYEVKAELPGVPKEKIDVTVADGQLEIRADAGRQREETRKNYYRREIESQSFYRSIPLPNDAEAERVDAELKDGCLTVRLPKSSAPSRGRRVDVR